MGTSVFEGSVGAVTKKEFVALVDGVGGERCRFFDFGLRSRCQGGG